MISQKTPVHWHARYPLDPAANLPPFRRNHVSPPVRMRKIHVVSCRAAPLPAIPEVSLPCIGRNGTFPSRTPQEGRRPGPPA